MKSMSPLSVLLISFATTIVLASSAFAADHIVPSTEELVGPEVPPVVPALTATDVDFDSLREAWGRRRDFDQLCERTFPGRELESAAKAADNVGVYALAARFLAQCPVSEQAQAWAMSAAQKLGDSDKASLHRRWLFGLTDSAMRTGDGKTPQTAYVTISVDEEYAIALRLGFQADSQTQVLGPPMADVLTVHRLGGGDKGTLYFNPAWHFARFTAASGVKPPAAAVPAISGPAPTEAR